jgi:hypothetical protein
LLQVADLFGSAERHVFNKFGSDLRLSTLEAAMGKQQEIPSPVQQASFLAVLRIRDILVRIRIRGSVPLTNGSGSAVFVSDLQDGNLKLLLVFAYFFKLHLHHHHHHQR